MAIFQSTRPTLGLGISESVASTAPDTFRMFVPGPVPVAPHLLAVGNQQLPYNRTEAFSEVTHDIHRGLQHLFRTDGSIAQLTASGTAAMEAAVINFLDASSAALVINGGTFGQRWSDLCDAHSMPYEEILLSPGDDLDLVLLDETLSGGQFSALLINAHETSSGQLYDIEAIGKIARRHGVLFVVDAISSICADSFEMDAWNVDVCILSTQKALALPPGMSFVAMSKRALDLLESRTSKGLYFNLKDYLTNQSRGQSPYTPAIGLMLQLHQRLTDIAQESVPLMVSRHAQRARYFRDAISSLAFEVLPSRSSNAMTALSCGPLNALEVVEHLRSRYHIIVAPSGGAMKTKLIRIAHMGDQQAADVELLIAALSNIDAGLKFKKIL